MTHLSSFLLIGCKATLILAIVSVLLCTAGRRWPQSCTLGERLALIALLLLPVAVFLLPTIGIPLLQNPAPHSAVDSTFPRENGSTWLNLVAAPTGADRTTAWDQRSVNVNSQFSLARSATLCFKLIYGVVVLALVHRFLRAWLGLRRLRADSALLIDSRWQADLAHWSEKLHVRRAVELRTSTDVNVPMTFGWRIPVILIPNRSVDSCDQTDRSAILIHELTHISHHDYLWHVLTQVTAAFYWMHPLMWYVRRQEGTVRERICDTFCSQHLSRESYMQALVRIAGRNVPSPAIALGMAMAHESSLKRRLKDLANGSTRKAKPNLTLQIVFGGMAATLFAAIAIGTLTARAPAQEKKSEAADTTRQAADSSKSSDEPVAKPIPLPEKLVGQVLDRNEKAVPNAKVTIHVRKGDGRPDSSKPEPWLATTDEQGRFQVSTNKKVLRPGDFLEMKIQAENFAESEQYPDVEGATKGELPVVHINAGRKVQGQIVHLGKPLADVVVRFQSNQQTMQSWETFDSGPLRTNDEGKFAATIPEGGAAAVAIYPRGFAPLIVTIPSDTTDLGLIGVETGTALTGRVIDKQGRAVAGTVVAVESVEHVELFAYLVLISLATTTDENGEFTLAPLRGGYVLTVTDGAADYSRRRYVRGKAPPPILPLHVELDGKEKTKEIILREAKSAMVRGTVRWADGSPVPNFEIRATAMVAGSTGSELPTGRTDQEGRYSLQLPVPLPRVHLSAGGVQAADGTYQEAKVIGRGPERNLYLGIEFERLTRDVEEVDWVVNSAELPDSRSYIVPDSP